MTSEHFHKTMIHNNESRLHLPPAAWRKPGQWLTPRRNLIGYAMLKKFHRNCIPLFYHLFKRLQHRWIKIDKTCWLQACVKQARQKKTKKTLRINKNTFAVVDLNKALLTHSNIFSCSIHLATPGSFITDGLQYSELSQEIGGKKMHFVLPTGRNVSL